MMLSLIEVKCNHPFNEVSHVDIKKFLHVIPHHSKRGLDGDNDDDDDDDMDDDDFDDDEDDGDDDDDDMLPHCSKRDQGIGSDQCSRCLWSVAPPSLSPGSSRSLSRSLS